MSNAHNFINRLDETASDLHHLVTRLGKLRFAIIGEVPGQIATPKTPTATAPEASSPFLNLLSHESDYLRSALEDLRVEINALNEVFGEQTDAHGKAPR